MSLPLKSLSNSFIRTVEVDYVPPLVTATGIAMSVSPATGAPFVFERGDGLSPQSYQYVITNTGPSDLIWLAAADVPWVTLDYQSGTLLPGTSITVTVTGDAVAIEALPDGVYAGMVTFTNQINGQGNTARLVQAVVSPVPQVAAAFVSEAGTGTLIGFSEYASPSVPPKKYRVQTLSGFTYACDFLGFTCPSSNVRGISRYDYSGNATYNATTGALVNNSVETVRATVTNPGIGCGENFPNGPGFPFNQVPAVTPFAPQNVGDSSTVSSPATRTWTWTGACGARFSYHGSVEAALSTEDTEQDAIARASKTPGTSPQSRIETRGAGDFTFDFRTSTGTLTASDLVPGLSYRITVDLLTEDYGGGSPVNSQDTIDFVASAASEPIIYNVPQIYGKQVTASNPTIALNL